MNRTTSRRVSCLSMRKAGAALSLTLACCLGMGTAHAQVLVMDVTTEAETTASYGEEAAQTLKQISQYETQLQQYQQMLSSIQGITSGMSLLPNTLQHADYNSVVTAACGGGSGISNILGTVISDVASEITGNTPIQQQQQEICAKITYYQVDQYNTTVDMLNKMTGAYQQQFQKIEGIANGISSLTQADTGNVTAQEQKYSNTISSEMSTFNAQMEADTNIIKTLQAQQSILARIAFKGNPNLIGDATQAAILTAVFKVN